MLIQYGNVLPSKWVVTQVPATRPDTATRPAGSGWPEQCPPMQAAAAFGWASDLNQFDGTTFCVGISKDTMIHLESI